MGEFRGGSSYVPPPSTSCTTVPPQTSAQRLTHSHLLFSFVLGATGEFSSRRTSGREVSTSSRCRSLSTTTCPSTEKTTSTGSDDQVGSVERELPSTLSAWTTSKSCGTLSSTTRLKLTVSPDDDHLRPCSSRTWELTAFSCLGLASNRDASQPCGNRLSAMTMSSFSLLTFSRGDGRERAHRRLPLCLRPPAANRVSRKEILASSPLPTTFSAEQRKKGLQKWSGNTWPAALLLFVVCSLEPAPRAFLACPLIQPGTPTPPKRQLSSLAQKKERVRFSLLLSRVREVALARVGRRKERVGLTVPPFWSFVSILSPAGRPFSLALTPPSTLVCFPSPHPPSYTTQGRIPSEDAILAPPLEPVAEAVVARSTGRDV